MKIDIELISKAQILVKGKARGASKEERTR